MKEESKNRTVSIFQNIAPLEVLVILFAVFSVVYTSDSLKLFKSNFSEESEKEIVNNQDYKYAGSWKKLNKDGSKIYWICNTENSRDPFSQARIKQFNSLITTNEYTTLDADIIKDFPLLEVESQECASIILCPLPVGWEQEGIQDRHSHRETRLRTRYAIHKALSVNQFEYSHKEINSFLLGIYDGEKKDIKYKILLEEYNKNETDKKSEKESKEVIFACYVDQEILKQKPIESVVDLLANMPFEFSKLKEVSVVAPIDSDNLIKLQEEFKGLGALDSGGDINFDLKLKFLNCYSTVDQREWLNDGNSISKALDVGGKNVDFVYKNYVMSDSEQVKVLALETINKMNKDKLKSAKIDGANIYPGLKVLVLKEEGLEYTKRLLDLYKEYLNSLSSEVVKQLNINEGSGGGDSDKVEMIDYTVINFAKNLYSEGSGGQSDGFLLPSGSQQLDYIQRAFDESNFLGVHGGFDVVVIFGGGVEDKIYLVQALKKVLSKTIYLTTDYDYKYSISDYRKILKNLIYVKSVPNKKLWDNIHIDGGMSVLDLIDQNQMRGVYQQYILNSLVLEVAGKGEEAEGQKYLPRAFENGLFFSYALKDLSKKNKKNSSSAGAFLWSVVSWGNKVGASALHYILNGWRYVSNAWVESVFLFGFVVLLIYIISKFMPVFYSKIGNFILSIMSFLKRFLAVILVVFLGLLILIGSFQSYSFEPYVLFGKLDSLFNGVSIFPFCVINLFLVSFGCLVLWKIVFNDWSYTWTRAGRKVHFFGIGVSMVFFLIVPCVFLFESAYWEHVPVRNPWVLSEISDNGQNGSSSYPDLANIYISENIPWVEILFVCSILVNSFIFTLLFSCCFSYCCAVRKRCEKYSENLFKSDYKITPKEIADYINEMEYWSYRITGRSKYALFSLVLLWFCLNESFDNWSWTFGLSFYFVSIFIAVIVHLVVVMSVSGKLKYLSMLYLESLSVCGSVKNQYGANLAESLAVVSSVNQGFFQTISKQPLMISIVVLIGGTGLFEIIEQIGLRFH